jgi:hypothetical protein
VLIVEEQADGDPHRTAEVAGQQLFQELGFLEPRTQGNPFFQDSGVARQEANAVNAKYPEEKIGHD